MQNVLLWLFFTPLLMSMLILVVPACSNFLKAVAFFLSLTPLFLLLTHHVTLLGSEFNHSWLPALSINFHLQIDELSLVFLYLSAVIVPLSIVAINTAVITRPKVFYFLVFILQALLVAFFTTKDLAFFTICWEAMLLPLYFIILLWGSDGRQAAALKFLVYMIAGSALMVVAVLALYFGLMSTSGSSSFNLDDLQKVALSAPYAPWILAIFLLAFAVKTPLFPFHAWLPDTYFQASTSGTILLSGILSKAGIYGIIRICFALFPLLMQQWSPYLLALAIAGVFYGAFAAWQENNFKRLLSYSSFSHVNFILVGLFVWQQNAHSGAILQALNHGVTIAALFLVAGWLQERLGSTLMSSAGGLAATFPKLCWLTLFFVCSSVALPGTNNFIGEFLIFNGLFAQYPFIAAILALSVVFSAVYMLRLMKKAYFGPLNPGIKFQKDLSSGDLIIGFTLAAIISWVGIYPAVVLSYVQPAAQKTAVAAHATIQDRPL